VEDFGLWLQSLVSQLAVFGKVVEEEDVVAKLLRVVPAKYTQLALLIETMLDMSTLTIEDVTGRLRAGDDRTDMPAKKEKDGGKLLLTEEEWTARMKEKWRSGEGSSSRGGGGNKRRGKAPRDKKKKHVDPNACRRCGKTGHWARECPTQKQEEKKEEAHLAQADDDDKHTFLMASFCALHDVEAEGKTKGAERQITGVLQRLSTLTSRVLRSILERWAASRSRSGTWTREPATT
jgi:hypothetical protein